MKSSWAFESKEKKHGVKKAMSRIPFSFQQLTIFAAKNYWLVQNYGCNSLRQS